MPDLINKATHLKQNARKAKSFARKVQKRQDLAKKASRLSPTMAGAAKGSSTALVVRTATSMTTGFSTKTISKKKQIKRERNARYQSKNAAAISAAISQDMDDSMMQEGTEKDLSSTQKKIRARSEANLRAKEQAIALASILAAGSGSSAFGALQGEMEIETNGSGTTLGRPRVF